MTALKAKTASDTRRGFLRKLIADIRDRESYVKRATEQAGRECEKLSALVRRIKSTRACRWLDVKETKLQIDKLYIIRRAYPVRKESPCVAEWTTQGWRELFGTIPRASERYATIEVWSR